MRALVGRVRPCLPARRGGVAPRPRHPPPLRARDDGVDIDALAAALAAAAAARTAAGELEELEVEEVGAIEPPPPSLAPFDAASASARAEEVFAELGDGGFDPASVELLSKLGSMAWSSDGGRSAPSVAGAVFAARFSPGAPLQAPVLVLVKEYAPAATAFACNDLQACALLAGGRLPLSKWHAANGLGPPAPRAPTYPLLGYFRAAPSTGEGGIATYLVFKWERAERGGVPLDVYPGTRQPPPSGLAALFGSWGASRRAEAALADRACMVRTVAARSARALAAVHAAGVAHGSLGAGCVMVSTARDDAWRGVRVTVVNFMFSSLRRRGSAAAAAVASSDGDDPVSVAQAVDGVALAKLLLETALRALGGGGGGDAAAPTLARRALAAAADAGGGDAGAAAAREVVAAAPGFESAVACFDADAGWAFLAALAAGARLDDVAASPFVVEWG